jgi:small subunit ribosomal protein S8
MSDPIADYLTRVRNAFIAKHSKVDIPSSNIIIEITRILMEEGYIKNYTIIDEEKRNIIRIYLKYGESQKSTISGLKRISRPGLRRYTKANEIPRVLNGLGVAVISTPKGVLTGKKAREQNVGGEVICYIW